MSTARVNRTHRTSFPYLKTVVVLVLFGCLLVGSLPLVSLYVLPPSQEAHIHASWVDVLNQYSAYGQMFGLLNAIFSGGALVGVIYALFMQRQELRLQRRELRLQRRELKRSAKAQQEAERALKEQVQSSHNASFLHAASALAQTYGHLFSLNPKQYRNEYIAALRIAKDMPNEADRPKPENTIEGKFEYFRVQLETLFMRMGEQSHFDLKAQDAFHTDAGLKAQQLPTL